MLVKLYKMSQTEALAVKYTYGCLHHPKSQEITGWQSFVDILIPRVCPKCDEGDYYKLYIGRNRYHIEGDTGVINPDDPESLLIRMKLQFFQELRYWCYPMLSLSQ